MSAALTHKPAYVGLYLALLLSLACNAFLDIRYGAFVVEIVFWAVVQGVTLFVGWRQHGEPQPFGVLWQRWVLGLGLLLFLLIAWPMWGMPRAGVYFLAVLQAAQNCVTIQRRQLHFGLLVSVVLVIFATSHHRADWTMLFYLLPYIGVVVFTWVSEQVSRHGQRVRQASLGPVSQGGQVVAVLSASGLILLLGLVLYSVTPQPSLAYLEWRYGQQTNIGHLNAATAMDGQGQGGSSGSDTDGSGGAGMSVPGSGSGGFDLSPLGGWPSSQDMRSVAQRSGMPGWQSRAILGMADLQDVTLQAMVPLELPLQELLEWLRQWWEQYGDIVPRVLLVALILAVVLAGFWLLKESYAGIWLRSRFDRLYLVEFGGAASGRGGAMQYYRALERVLWLAGTPRPAGANAREYQRHVTRWQRGVDADMAAMTQLYEQCRYGAQEPGPEQLERLRQLYRSIGRKLG